MNKTNYITIKITKETNEWLESNRKNVKMTKTKFMKEIINQIEIETNLETGMPIVKLKENIEKNITPETP